MAGTALITGASSGIGLELARLFARDGYRVILLARGEDKLQTMAADFKREFKVDCVVVSADLADPQAPQAVFDRLQRDGIEVDVLVNNAGYGVFGEFLQTDVKAELDMLQVNITALTHLTKLFLPGMRARQSGRVLNVASTAAFQPGPLMACYYATKAYVLSFSEAIDQELRGSGVTVTALCPGPTETGFQKLAKMDASSLFKNATVMDAGQVAAIGYRALMRGQRLVIAGRRNTIMAFSIRFVPRWFAPWLVQRMQQATH